MKKTFPDIIKATHNIPLDVEEPMTPPTTQTGMATSSYQEDWEEKFSKVMLRWIFGQWKIEEAHRDGAPYTRMKLEAEAAKVESELKDIIRSEITKAVEARTEEIRNKVIGDPYLVYDDNNRSYVRSVDEKNLIMWQLRKLTTLTKEDYEKKTNR